jgi:hypothetical protein
MVAFYRSLRGNGDQASRSTTGKAEALRQTQLA